MSRNKFILLALFLPIASILGGFYLASITDISSVSTVGKETIETTDKIKPEKQDGGQARILFVGDIMFDRYIRQVAQKKGYDFILENVKNLLSKSDLVIGNLEGPVTESRSVSLGTQLGEKNNYIFTFDPVVTETLKSHNIRMVNLGNNHILNFGKSGFEETKKYLQESKVEYFGSVREEKISKIKEIRGIKIGFLNFNEFSGENAENLAKGIRILKDKADFIIIYTHWGKEYVDSPNEETKNLAHSFIDAGADLIVGSHPHVIQGSEKYKSKKIYYSLGNFVFDQYFEKETDKGLIVEAILKKNGEAEFKEYKVKMEPNGQTKLISN